MILITGNKGFIGSRLQNVIGGEGIDFIEGKNLLTCPLPPADVIYHLAAQTSVRESWNDPVHDLDNIRITARLVKEYPNAKIIYASSAAALPPISSPYGFSKWASAVYIQTFHKNYVICTLPNVYGGGKSVVDLFKGAEHVTIYGDGTHVRDYVHIDDIVAGLVKAKQWPKGEYEMGSGIGTSVLELAEGKRVTFLPEIPEAKESVLKNTTPDWEPSIEVLNYIQ